MVAVTRAKRRRKTEGGEEGGVGEGGPVVGEAGPGRSAEGGEAEAGEAVGEVEDEGQADQGQEKEGERADEKKLLAPCGIEHRPAREGSDGYLSFSFIALAALARAWSRVSWPAQ